MEQQMRKERDWFDFVVASADDFIQHLFLLS